MWIGSSRGGDRTRLVRVDLSTDEESEVDSHPDLELAVALRTAYSDPSSLIQSRATGELIGTRYLGERQVIQALDPGFAEVWANLEKLSEGDLAAVSCDDSGQRWVVSFAHDRDPEATYFYDFRGSSGFGKAHMKAAIGEFAGKMHDDLIDGVDWAVARGYADPDRVAVFGTSYGGYVALVSVTFTPDRFVAIDCVGISDLANFMRTQPAFVRPSLVNNWYRYVGDPAVPEQEADMLARSPISRVDEIRTPLMVVQGANDARVVKAESDQLVDGLRERGVDVEYLVFDDEGHAVVNTENLITMFGAAERFLARHLGGRQRWD